MTFRFVWNVVWEFEINYVSSIIQGTCWSQIWRSVDLTYWWEHLSLRERTRRKNPALFNFLSQGIIVWHFPLVKNAESHAVMIRQLSEIDWRKMPQIKKSEWCRILLRKHVIFNFISFPNYIIHRCKMSLETLLNQYILIVSVLRIIFIIFICHKHV